MTTVVNFQVLEACSRYLMRACSTVRRSSCATLELPSALTGPLSRLISSSLLAATGFTTPSDGCALQKGGGELTAGFFGVSETCNALLPAVGVDIDGESTVGARFSVTTSFGAGFSGELSSAVACHTMP
jgi:hypothetical protein